MNNNQRTTIAIAVLLGITSCAMNAEAACTQHKRVLRLDVNAIELEQKDARCVLFEANEKYGTFEIKVKPGSNYDVDLDAIAIDAKVSNGPVSFEVIEVRTNEKILVVRVTWADNADLGVEYGYTVTVPDLGVLDPTVQIIRTSPMMAYSSALEQFAKEYLDQAAYDFIVREMLPDEAKATAE